ncbi:MAG: hypothetical protein ABJE95_09660 [Byssovorax sp.]
MFFLVVILLGAVAAAVGLSRVAWGGHFVNALAEGRVGPSLLDRMNELLEPYQGVQLSAEDLESLEARAAAHFVDILANDGFVVRGWQVVLRNDEVLGPQCFLKSSAGAELSLVEFTLRLRKGTIAIDGG